MRAIALTSTIVAVAIGAAGSAAGAGQRDGLVRPGVSIGKVRLGMTPAEVFRVLGRPSLINRRIDHGFGSRYIEYDWDYTRWTVGFAGRADSLRASKIGTTLRTQRTPRGIGVGSRVRDILRAYPTAACVGRWYDDPDPGTWVYIGRRPRITAFHVLYNINYEPTRLGRVSEVVVQKDWITRSRGRGCGPEWRTR
jgi:hypothetical protein